jgi:hypothetical protein
MRTGQNLTIHLSDEEFESVRAISARFDALPLATVCRQLVRAGLDLAKLAAQSEERAK